VFAFRLVPDNTRIPFMRYRSLAFAISGLLMVLSLLLIALRGLNFGIDFEGGILVEVRTPEVVEIGHMRAALGGLGLGEVALQEFGGPRDVLIRIQRQVGAEEEQLAAVGVVREALVAEYGEETSFRRVEFVGPKVSEELLRAGIMAVLFSLVAVLAYIWFRFEWHFGAGAIAALIHDVVLTLGIFSLLQLEFNLATVAAVLTIVGYSLNDTVVVYDRVRENLRRYKATPLVEVLDRSINDMLARTVVTSFTTLLALITLFAVGGPVIQGFIFALIWGVLIGTYSSIFVAAPLLLQLNLRPEAVQAPAEAQQARP
jgi:preprotein translocase subunit SecF